MRETSATAYAACRETPSHFWFTTCDGSRPLSSTLSCCSASINDSTAASTGPPATTAPETDPGSPESPLIPACQHRLEAGAGRSLRQGGPCRRFRHVRPVGARVKPCTALCGVHARARANGSLPEEVRLRALLQPV